LAVHAAQPDADLRRVFAILPAQPVEALLSLKRNCKRIDVLLPEWLEIGGPRLALSRVDLDPEMAQGIKSMLRAPESAPLLMPVVNLAHTVNPDIFASRLRGASYRAMVAKDIAKAAADLDAVGVCLRFQGFNLVRAPSLLPLLHDVDRALSATGKTLCLVSSADDMLWKNAEIVRTVGQFVVTAFKEPWRGSTPSPLAPASWFAETLQDATSAVGPGKLVILLASHSVDWISGKAIPEQIGFAETMYRAAAQGAEVRFSPEALNSHLSFVDSTGLLHQVWMLDAASFANSLNVLGEFGIRNVGVASMGLEDPSLWTLLDRDTTQPVDALLRRVELPDYVAYRGSGPFYRIVSTGEGGQRALVHNATTGQITGQTYTSLPQPYRMERYGTPSPHQVALTFDDGPDRRATSRILDVLKAKGAPATFFVVGRQAIQMPDILRRIVDEGHMIGSHTFFHPRMEDVSDIVALSELNGLRNLVEGFTGRTPRLYRAPYERGPGPITGHGAARFALMEDEGYVVTGSDVVPPDWSGISADAIVTWVLQELAQEGGNVIVLHDARFDGMHTAEAVEKLIPALRALGYQIVPLSTLLGTTDSALLPSVDGIAGAFNSLSFGALGSAIWLAIALFWLTLVAGILRAVTYLFIAQRRQPFHVRVRPFLPSVTVVIPAYNEEVVILQTIVSVLRSDYPDLKVIVVDDGSSDKTRQIVDSHYWGHPRVRLISQPNQGKWQALNTAYSAIDTEIAVCVDADTKIARNAIRELVQPFADSRVGAVAGTVVVGNRTNLLTRMQAMEYITAQQIVRRAQEHLNGILVVPGALGAWRVEALKDDIGLYSNETLTEDADLTILMRRGGYRVAYAEGALAYTEAPGDLRSFMKQRLRWSLGNLQSLWKHRGAFGEAGSTRLVTMLDMILFGYLLPLVAPIMDILFLFFATRIGLTIWNDGDLSQLDLPLFAVIAFIAVPLIDVLVGWKALRYDRRTPMTLLLVVPLMSFFYRQLLYVTVYRVLWSALTGRLAGWNKLRRSGLQRSAAGL
jgi:cellulose synthase/poly-beta-1,6-N-acetylglucosamine synthase-like glycosyltransferase/peptidoglycan/xylan/chitin deacetylase (PgdA/CDA1 family)